MVSFTERKKNFFKWLWSGNVGAKILGFSCVVYAPVAAIWIMLGPNTLFIYGGIVYITSYCTSLSDEERKELMNEIEEDEKRAAALEEVNNMEKNNGNTIMVAMVVDVFNPDENVIIAEIKD